MATRIYFVSKPFSNPIYDEMEIEFEYFRGLSISQKQKSIGSMHENIRKRDGPRNILEISTKSPDPVGVKLSGFNLMYHDEINNIDYPVENVFQSSKVFEGGGPYRDLLLVHPRDAKRDKRLGNSGYLKHFDHNGTIWNRVPEPMFYDWIYMNALHRDRTLSEEVLRFDTFTDIEFNHKNMIRCQARSAAIYVSLYKSGMLEETLKDTGRLRDIYPPGTDENSPKSLFNF